MVISAVKELLEVDIELNDLDLMIFLSMTLERTRRIDKNVSERCTEMFISSCGNHVGRQIGGMRSGILNKKERVGGRDSTTRIDQDYVVCLAYG
jgi:hypothetical protein